MARPTCPACESDRVLTTIRATEEKEEWGDAAVLECVPCGEQWSE